MCFHSCEYSHAHDISQDVATSGWLDTSRLAKVLLFVYFPLLVLAIYVCQATKPKIVYFSLMSINIVPNLTICK